MKCRTDGLAAQRYLVSAKAPESRRAMVDRGRLFDVPTYRWIPAKSRVEVEYWAIMRDAEIVPELLQYQT